MKAPTRDEILEAYSEKLAADIEQMSDEEVQAQLAEYEEAESFGKLASDQEALGRFMHMGWKGGIEDFDEFLKEAGGDFDAAVEAFEEDLEKMAAEIADAEEEAEKAAAEADGELTAEEFAIQTALEADPEALKTAALKVLEEQGITLSRVDAEGNRVELQLS